MWKRARRTLVYAVIAALAVANGFAPRHAHAARQLQPQAPVATGHTHDHGAAAHRHHHGAAGHHDHGAADHAAVPHRDNGEPGKNNAAPDQNCCVASCSAIAFIFAAFDFSDAQPREIFAAPPARPLRPASLSSIDPPPRLA